MTSKTLMAVKEAASAERLLSIGTGTVVDVLFSAGFNTVLVAEGAIPCSVVADTQQVSSLDSLAILASRRLLRYSKASLASAAVRSGLKVDSRCDVVIVAFS